MNESANHLLRFMPLVRGIFVGCLTALGVIHVISGPAVTRMFPWWPEWLPGRPYWAHTAGALLAILGGLALCRVRPRATLAWMGALILLAVLLLGLSRPITPDQAPDKWLNVSKWSAMAAAAFLFANTLANTGNVSLLDRLIGFFSAAAKWLLAAFMVGAAILHVRFAAPIAQYYIPAYLPWREFWAYFSAGTLTAGGVGLLIPQTARLAGLLTSLMIFLWCPLIHIPRTFAEPRNPGEWCGIFESVAFAAMALLLAMRARRSPGL
jgi:uncharacterized membrane protein